MILALVESSLFIFIMLLLFCLRSALIYELLLFFFPFSFGSPPSPSKNAVLSVLILLLFDPLIISDMRYLDIFHPQIILDALMLQNKKEVNYPSLLN